MELNQSTLPQYLKVLTDKGVIFEKTPSYLVRNGIVGDSAVDMATVANGGIPAAAAQIIDPMIIKQLFAPTVATQLYPEVKRATGRCRTFCSRAPKRRMKSLLMTTAPALARPT
jgi:hypothetical protein